MTVCIVSTDINLSVTIGQQAVRDLASAEWCERELFIPGYKSKMAAQCRPGPCGQDSLPAPRHSTGQTGEREGLLGSCQRKEDFRY